MGILLPFTGSLNLVIMIGVATEETNGSDRVLDLNDYERALGWKRQTHNESEMALFTECMQ